MPTARWYIAQSTLKLIRDLTEEHASEGVRPVEQRCIVDLVVMVLVRREDSNPAGA